MIKRDWELLFSEYDLDSMLRDQLSTIRDEDAGFTSANASIGDVNRVGNLDWVRTGNPE